MEEKFDYLIQQTNERLDKIDENLMKLLTFKWKIIGGSVIFSIFITLGINLVMIITK